MITFFRCTAVVVIMALSMITSCTRTHALENHTAIAFTNAACCAKPADDQICFYEKAEFQGKCACARLAPDYEDLMLGNGGAYGSIHIPVTKALVLNVFTDDFVRNTASFEVSCSKSGIARRFTIGRRDSVCLYTKANFHGEKLCLLPSAKRHHCVDGFKSVLFFPTTNPKVQADIANDQCRSSSAGLLGNETEVDRRRFDVAVSYVNQGSSAKQRAP
ncbi:hypothetical protein FI667_g15160, partial [Globisporangium splendens]